MPIRKEFRRFYTAPEYRQARELVKARAGDCCEWCGKLNHSYVWVAVDGTGRWWKEGQPPADAAVRIIRVVLTTAHLNHDPADNRLVNLAFLCQACHLKYDRKQHWAMARRARARRVGQLWLCPWLESAPLAESLRMTAGWA
jgi:hypothetical protein